MDDRVTIFILFGLGLSTGACSRGPETPAAAAGPPEMTVVAVARATPEALTRQVELTGEFRPYQAVDIHAKVSGYLKKITVDVGDQVSAGHLLGILEVPEMRDDVAQANASTKRFTAEVDRARRELERAETNRRLAELSYRRLSEVGRKEPGLIAQQELDESFSRRQNAEAQVAASKAAIAAAEESVGVAQATEQRTKTLTDYTRITAPFAGVITKRYADAGALIQAGTSSHQQALPLVRLAQIDRLRLVLPVPESAVSKVRLGAPLTIRVASLDREFEGRIARISKDVLLSTRTMEVEVDVVNPGGVLMPGMYASTTLTLEHRENVLTVPAQALASREGKRSVLVVNGDGVVEDRTVELGLETAGKVEVVRGVAAGDLVVIGNRGQLRPGQKVEPKIQGLG